jgi:hypothetical protein
MRSFTIESVKKMNGSRVNYTEGRYMSETASQSAKKAFTKIYHHLDAKGPLSLKITMKETTQNSNKKEYTYRVTKKTDKVEVERDGKIITYNFTTKVKSLN